MIDKLDYQTNSFTSHSQILFQSKSIQSILTVTVSEENSFLSTDWKEICCSSEGLKVCVNFLPRLLLYLTFKISGYKIYSSVDLTLSSLLGFLSLLPSQIYEPFHTIYKSYLYTSLYTKSIQNKICFFLNLFDIIHIDSGVMKIL